MAVAGALACLFIFAAPSVGDTVAVKATDGLVFKPAVKKIHKGDKVVWKNVSGLAHTITAYKGGTKWSFDKALGPGEKVTRKFTEKGTYTFRCTVRGHSFVSGGDCGGMCGKIKVVR